jgi:hypothetical protein
MDRDSYRDLTRRFLEGFVEDSDIQPLNEVTSADRARALQGDAEEAASDAANARRLAQQADKHQLTLNQGEVDQVDAMTRTLDKMFFEYRKIKSVPSEWLDGEFGASRYDKLESLLMDASEEMSDLAHDMKKGGI